LEELDASDERIAGLTGQLDRALAELDRRALRVAKGRRAAAARLAEAVSGELVGLAMAGAQLRIDVPDTPPGPNGTEDVVFLLAAHPGAPLRALGKAASGGELSRVMLAVEVCLAQAQGSPPETLVFDEVDAGVGGRAAIEVGRRLARVAAHAQVIVVTHLAQVAAFADRHIVLEKATSPGGGRAVTEAREVTGAGRERELARMLAGHEESASAQAHASELLAMRAASGV
jgi:DNA repair protein RecN (Recombination protein N)